MLRLHQIHHGIYIGRAGLFGLAFEQRDLRGYREIVVFQVRTVAARVTSRYHARDFLPRERGYRRQRRR